MKYYSQAGQDEWVLFLIKKGYFLDIGAYDGEHFSNTYVLEKAGWDGLCIDASRANYDAMTQIRYCKMMHLAVANYTGTITMDDAGATTKRKEDGGMIVQCDTISNILHDYNIPKHINYISLDVEGMESEIIEIFPFDEYLVDLLTIEHNLYCDGNENKNKIFEVMERSGFERVRENVECDGNAFEDWYKNKKFNQ